MAMHKKHGMPHKEAHRTKEAGAKGHKAHERGPREMKHMETKPEGHKRPSMASKPAAAKPAPMIPERKRAEMGKAAGTPVVGTPNHPPAPGGSVVTHRVVHEHIHRHFRAERPAGK